MRGFSLISPLGLAKLSRTRDGAALPCGIPAKFRSLSAGSPCAPTLRVYCVEGLQPMRCSGTEGIGPARFLEGCVPAKALLPSSRRAGPIPPGWSAACAPDRSPDRNPLYQAKGGRERPQREPAGKPLRTMRLPPTSATFLQSPPQDNRLCRS